MFVLTVKGFEDEGAYSLPTKGGGKVLLLFEEYDDADRYAQLLECDEPQELYELFVKVESSL